MSELSFKIEQNEGKNAPRLVVFWRLIFISISSYFIIKAKPDKNMSDSVLTPDVYTSKKDLKGIVGRKTKMGHEWYQSPALSLLFRRLYFF